MWLVITLVSALVCLAAGAPATASAANVKPARGEYNAYGDSGAFSVVVGGSRRVPRLPRGAKPRVGRRWYPKPGTRAPVLTEQAAQRWEGPCRKETWDGGETSGGFDWAFVTPTGRFVSYHYFGPRRRRPRAHPRRDTRAPTRA